MMTAIEHRFDASVLLSGGLFRYPEDWPPGAIPQNFAPRSIVPTLMINGRDDFGAPVETNIQPMFDCLGTADEHKRLVLLEGGHVPASPNEVIREVLDWLDLYLGPVETGGLKSDRLEHQVAAEWTVRRNPGPDGTLAAFDEPQRHLVACLAVDDHHPGVAFELPSGFWCRGQRLPCRPASAMVLRCF